MNLREFGGHGVRKDWLFLTLLVWLSAGSAQGQLSEIQLTPFVPDDTVIGITVNIESLRNHVDMESEIVQFLVDGAMEDSGIDLATLNRIVMCAGYDYERSDRDWFGSEESMVTQFLFAQPMDFEKYHDANSWGRTFEEQEIGDFQMYVGEWENEEMTFNPGAMCLDADKQHLFIGGNERILKAIEANSDAGLTMVNQMDAEADLAIEFDFSELEGADRERVLGWFDELRGQMGLDAEALEGLQSGSLLIDVDQDRTGYAELRFADEETAGKVKTLIQQGIAALPFLISMLEGELGNMEPDELKTAVADLIPVLKKMVASSTVTLDGANVEVVLESEGGFPELPGLAMLTMYGEIRMVEQKMAEVEVMRDDLEMEEDLSKAKSDDDDDDR